MKFKTIIFLLLALFYLPVFSIAARAEISSGTVHPGGAGVVYQTTLEGFSGGAGFVSTSKNFVDHVIGGLKGKLPMKTGGVLEIGIGDILFQSLGLMVFSISPASAYNIAPVHIDSIKGLNFVSKMVVKLTLTGEADIDGTSVTAVSSEQLACDFNVTGAKPGNWTVYVSREGYTSASLADAFKIESYAFPVDTVINSPNPFDPAREQTVFFYRLPQDTTVDVFIYSMTGNLLWKTAFTAGSIGGKSGENKLLWDGYSAFGNMLSNGVYFIHVIEKSSGKTLAKGKIAVIRR